MKNLFTTQELQAIQNRQKLRHDLWKFIYKSVVVFVLKFRADGGIHYAVFVNGMTTNINFNHIEIAATAGFEFVDGHTTSFTLVNEEMQYEVKSWNTLNPKS